MVVALLGGLGVFLLGMGLLTEGLKSVAGDALRQILSRFVRGPISGVGWGAVTTALVQSSAATTLTTVGFVSAGLLTFPQAVGVVFGANIGTTSTGWIVSQLGFKISLGSMSSPILLGGVLMRLLLRGRMSHLGTALAGLALLFMGIDMLQGSMGEVASRITPDDLPGGAATGRWWSRLALIGVGVLMTILTQSSSAAMTTTLAAASSGAIGLEQAAALIVGQNVGTTLIAAAAAIGAPAAAKRTAAAHVMFNLLTGVVAFTGLPLFLWGSAVLAEVVGVDDVPTTLAMFHTMFNIAGVLLLLPVVGPFSRMIERLIPEQGPRATRYLSRAVAELGPVALEAARRSLLVVLGDAANAGWRLVTGSSRRRSKGRGSLAETRRALSEIREFVHRLGRAPQGDQELLRERSLLHACDHIDRLLRELQHPREALTRWIDATELQPARNMVAVTLRAVDDACQTAETTSGAPTGSMETLAQDVLKTSQQIAAMRKSGREEAYALSAAGTLDPDQAIGRVDALLWLDAIAYHLWRATEHLREKPSSHEAALHAGVNDTHAQS